MKTAKYLLTDSAYIRLPDRQDGAFVGHGATRANPVLLEVPADHVPSRTWLPCNEAAQEALAALGVHVEIVPAPRPREEPREPDTNVDLVRRAGPRLAADMYGQPRASDTSPVGDPVQPYRPKMSEDDR